MKKKGLSVKFAEALLLIISLLMSICISIYFIIFHPEQDKGWIMIAIEIVGSAFLVFFVQSVMNVVRAVIWINYGYRNTPVCFLGILFNYGGKVTFSYDPTFIMEIFFPKDIIDEMSQSFDGAKLRRKTVRIEVTLLIIESSFYLVAIIASIALWSVYLIYMFLLSVLIFILIENTQSIAFHGMIVKIRFILNGYVTYYLARAATAVSSNYGEILTQFVSLEGMGNKFKEFFEGFSLCIWQGIILDMCYNRRIKLSESANEQLSKLTKSFKMNQWFITPEKLNILKMYIAWTIVSNSTDERKRMATELFHLIHWDNDVGKILRTELEWYHSISLLEGYDTGKRYHLIGYTDYERWFSTYKRRVRTLEQRIEQIVNGGYN